MVDERKALQDLATVKGTEHEDGSHTLSARGKTARCRNAGDVQAFLQSLPDAQAEADRVNTVGLKTYSQSDVVFTFRGGISPTRAIFEGLSDWTDWDGAALLVAQVIGVLPKDATLASVKHVMWSSNPLGDTLAWLMLVAVEGGLLERRDEPDIQYRLRPA